MSNDAAIKVQNLSKKYSLGAVHTNLLSEKLGNTLRSFYRRGLRRNDSPFTINHSQSSDSRLTINDSQSFNDSRFTIHDSREKDFWALRDVSFEVKQGEVLGIIGRNGAGKSTLLKILSRITKPTEGRIELYGRVASLLEVGTGFHPELTGRENIFLNGAILGMGRAEIRRKFDEIVAFAEVEKFIDTPVKRYSSGMYVRLAFAVAAHLEPEILIVDEVLAVGDAQFQKKCLGKMGDVAKEGRTVLFVSHNMGVVKALCTKAILLVAGRLFASGEVQEVVGTYFVPVNTGNLFWRPQNASGPFRYKAVSVVPEANDISGSIAAGASFQVVFDYIVEGFLPSGRIALTLTNQEGVVVLSSADTDAAPMQKRAWSSGRNICRCIVPAHLLVPGRYYLTISEPTEHGQDIVHDNIISFAINEQDSLAIRDGRQGVIAPLLSWNTVKVTDK